MLLNELDLCKIICDSIKTKECVDKCEHPFCFKCIRTACNIYTEEKRCEIEAREELEARHKIENECRDTIRRICGQYTDCDACPHADGYCDGYNEQSAPLSILQQWSNAMIEKEKEIEENKNEH